MNRKHTAVVAVILVSVVPVVAVLGIAAALGHRGPGNEMSSSGSGGSMAEPAMRDADTSGEAPGKTARQASDVAPLSRAVISTGQVTLHARDLGRAITHARQLVDGWGGVVADEQTDSDRHGRVSDSTLTLRVPSARFDEAMSALARLGDVEQQSRKSQDVTTKVLDTDARVRAGERAVAQLETLLTRATKLGDVIAIENDIATRQADLDSLKSQQKWLADQTSLSTITLYLSRPVPPAPHEARGFLTGLERGWHALGVAGVAVLTTLGAVLPFAVVVALFGVPLWWVVRRRRVAAPVGEA